MTKFEIDGKVYLKSQFNVVYDKTTHEVIGKWDEKEKKLIEMEEDEEEEEEEEED